MYKARMLFNRGSSKIGCVAFANLDGGKHLQNVTESACHLRRSSLGTGSYPAQVTVHLGKFAIELPALSLVRKCPWSGTPAIVIVMSM
jgi:hypothetical protein